eukprot:m.157294 g.157294  ORF g.157294 m.157294 type:complete len:347 (-) comp10226_c0_seq8:2356-3396(-)
MAALAPGALLAGGHAGEVFSLAVADDGALLSGGEDGLVVWHEGRPAAKWTIPVDLEADGVSALCAAPGSPHVVYGAFGETVAIFDRRALEKPVHEFGSSADEVNSVAVDAKNGHLAAADDAGDVRIFSLANRRPHKTFRGAHTNIVTSVAFRPGQPWDIVTGGLDSQIAVWDAAPRAPTRPRQVIDANSLGAALGKTIINPPMVHDVVFDAQGDKLAVALGSGAVALFGFGRRRKGDVAALHTQGHSNSVSRVVFAEDDSGRSLLVSGGNDRNICVWDPVAPWSLEEHLAALQIEDDAAAAAAPTPALLAQVRHSGKIDALAASRGTLFVAAQSPTIAIYRLTNSS